MRNENLLNDILVNNGLDFEIIKSPLVAIGDDGENLLTPYYGLFNSKSGECINTAKAGYTVSQNRDVLGMVLDGMEKFGDNITIKKASSIHGGRRVFIQLGITGVSRVGSDDITRYITVIDSNDGSTGLSVGIGDHVAHCDNQFFKFYKAGEAKFRHTATIKQKIESIPMLIETALNESVRQIEIYNKFQSTPLTKGLADRMVKAVMGYDKVYTSIEDQSKLGKRSIDMMELLYENIKTECNIVGDNLWGLFNGVTRYTTHHQIAPKRENGKIESLTVGTGYAKALAGFEFCLSAM